jgi:hypothetical protein
VLTRHHTISYTVYKLCAYHRSKRTIQTNLSASFTPSILCKYPTAAIHKHSKTPVPQHFLGYHLAAYHHVKPTSKYVWNFIQMQLHQPTRRHLLHDPNAFNVYRSKKSTKVNETSRCNKVKEPSQQLIVEQNTNLTPQHQAETAPSTILYKYRTNFFQSSKEVK